MEAEQGLLGCLLINNRSLEQVSDFLRPYHFYVPAHQRIYAAILKLAERGQIAGPVTLKRYFERDDELQHVGGADYLVDLSTSIITTVNAEDYGRTIYDAYMRRELIALCQSVMNEAYQPRIDLERGAADLIEQAEGKLFRLAET